MNHTNSYLVMYKTRPNNRIDFPKVSILYTIKKNQILKINA